MSFKKEIELNVSVPAPLPAILGLAVDCIVQSEIFTLPEELIVIAAEVPDEILDVEIVPFEEDENVKAALKTQVSREKVPLPPKFIGAP